MSNLLKDLKTVREFIVPLPKFVTHCCLVTNDAQCISSVYIKSHREFKMKGIKRASFKAIEDNMELLRSGQVILVEDNYHVIIPYYNPIQEATKPLFNNDPYESMYDFQLRKGGKRK